MIKAFLLAILRHAAVAAGAALTTWLIQNGASPHDAGALGGDLLIAVGVGASIYDKYQTHKDDGITWNGPRQGV